MPKLGSVCRREMNGEREREGRPEIKSWPPFSPSSLSSRSPSSLSSSSKPLPAQVLPAPFPPIFHGSSRDLKRARKVEARRANTHGLQGDVFKSTETRNSLPRHVTGAHMKLYRTSHREQTTLAKRRRGGLSEQRLGCLRCWG